MTTDPLAEMYAGHGPYVYADNDPIANIDYMGLAAASTQELIDKAWSQGNGTYDNNGDRIESEEDCCPGVDSKTRLNMAYMLSDQDGRPAEDWYQDILKTEGDAALRAGKEVVTFYVGGTLLKLLFKGGKWVYAGYRAKNALQAGDELVSAGRWMSKAEYETIKQTGRMVEGAGGQTFVSTGGAGSFTGAGAGSVYVEFQIAVKNLIQGGKSNWFKTLGPNAGKSQLRALEKQGGELLPEIFNITLK